MSGGQASLRTAAITLGMALIAFGTLSVLRGSFTPARDIKAQTTPLFADVAPRHRVAAAKVSLGPLETDDEAAALPTQLLAQIEPDDFPPAPKQPETFERPAENNSAPRRSPAAELLDVEPTTPATTEPETTPAATNCCDQQTRELARIAEGLEWLFRHTLLMLTERAHQAPAPPASEKFAPAERDVTAVIKIERTAEDRDKFSLEVRSAPVPDVFDALCELSGHKAEFAGNISLRVTLTLRDVTLAEAINRVLQQSDLGVERDGHILRVMPRLLAEERAIHRLPLETKQYRLHSKRMAHLLLLVRPLLTPHVGRLTVLPDKDPNSCPEITTGTPSADVLVVVDLATVHEAIAKLLSEVGESRTVPAR